GKRRGNVNLQVERLYNDNAAVDRLLMRGLCFAIVDEADSILIDEARTPFIIANERDGDQLQSQCTAALAAAASLSAADMHLDAASRRVELSASGQNRINTMTDQLSSNLRTREALVELALGALHIFKRDRDYIVRDQKIQIIDPNTGRIMPDRSWNRGLQQMIELKEDCPISTPRDTLAKLSFQRFFSRYLHLSGMTGTAHEVRSELWHTYRLPVVCLPTHRPGKRRRLPDQFFVGRAQKFEAIVERIRHIHQSGRPILVGTRSVADSEELSALLAKAGLVHQLLNARQDATEADIIAAAGQAGQITIATNMAGRGTDILLGDGVEASGGLHVIATERNDAARLDRQLYGRCARHGEPGSYEFFYSADDDLLLQNFPSPLHKLLKLLTTTPLAKLMLSPAVRLAQKRCEHRHRMQRRQQAIMQDQIDRLLSFSGQTE
ncbi:MAG: prepilin peptidase, partial [Gammaproteobacteria bacterium]|nr:prepilin peptidase [Gammaproteobacteria bacterium]